MIKPNFKLYIIVSLVILGILILLVSVYSLNRQQKQSRQIQNFPTPTSIMVIPTVKSVTKTEIINITPRFTGANEDIPQPTLSSAMQKQALKKKTPVVTTEYSIQYDYSSDVFVVTLNEPKSENKIVFENWREQNYPALPLSKFLLE